MSKTGEKLKGRKRPRSVLKKAWETRRAKKNLANWREIRATGSPRRTRKTRALTVANVKQMAAEASAALTPRSEAAAERVLTTVTDGLIASTIEDATEIEARAILVEARKKGGHQAIKERLQRMTRRAHHDGQKVEIELARREIKAITTLTTERIVCGFIAEVELAMRLHRGLPPDMVWNLSSFTVTKIIDALNDAGYTANGRQSRPSTASEVRKAT
jgi:hypothetical protein